MSTGSNNLANAIIRADFFPFNNILPIITTLKARVWLTGLGPKSVGLNLRRTFRSGSPRTKIFSTYYTCCEEEIEKQIKAWGLDKLLVTIITGTPRFSSGLEPDNDKIHAPGSLK